MKALIVLMVLTISQFAEDINFSNFDFNIKITATIYECTPWQETGWLYGVNKLFGKKSIEVTVYSHLDSLMINGNKMRKVTNGIYEGQQTRAISGVVPQSGYPTLQDGFKLISENKTTWFNCIVVGYHREKNGKKLPNSYFRDRKDL